MGKFSIKTAILILTFYILHSAFYVTPVFAQGDALGEAQINAASPLYFLKSVREILELEFAGTTYVRAVRKLEFANRRIREVKSLVDTTRQDLIGPTLEKYWSELQELSGLISLKDKDTAEQVSGTVVLHMDALQKAYTEISNFEARRSIRTAVNRLSQWEQLLIDKLNLAEQSDLAQKVVNSKLSACDFLAKEASSSALNEVEKVILSERAQKCLEPKL